MSVRFPVSFIILNRVAYIVRISKKIAILGMTPKEYFLGHVLGIAWPFADIMNNVDLTILTRNIPYLVTMSAMTSLLSL